MTLLCSSKQIVDSTLKNVCTNACIIYMLELHYMHALSKVQLHNEIIQVPYVLR